MITVTADDGRGGTVSDSFSLTVKAAPELALAIDDVSGLEVGATRKISLAGVFRDPDGDGLTVAAVSADEAVATVAAGASSLTLTGVAQGAATITVTARDADGNSVTAQFDVTVLAAPQPEPPAEAEETGVPDIVDRYDANDNGVIDVPEYLQARRDYAYGRLTEMQWQLIVDAWLASQYG